MKAVPNLISLSRIALLIALFFTFKNAYLFTVLYILCGASDFLDGYIARKTKTESELGARLDSLAVFVLFAVITAAIIVWMREEILTFVPAIILIVIVRLLNIAIAAYKYHSFAILHTFGNKAAGFLVFASPLLAAYRLTHAFWLVCAVAGLSALEETAIHFTSEILNINRKGIFFK